MTFKNYKLAIGTEVVFIRAIATDNTKIGDKGVVELNQILDYSYGIRKDNGYLLGVYNNEIETNADRNLLIEELLKDRLSYL